MLPFDHPRPLDYWSNVLGDGYSKDVLMSAHRRGELHTRKIGRTVMATTAAIQDWLECPETENPHESTTGNRGQDAAGGGSSSKAGKSTQRALAMSQRLKRHSANTSSAKVPSLTVHSNGTA